MAIRRVALTYDDYLATPDDGRRYEILDGEIQVSATPSTLHQRVLANLNDFIRDHVKSRSLGEVFFAPLAVILANTTVVEPDLIYVDRSRAGLVSSRGVEGAPTLLVEVLSPGTGATDRGPKFQLYARYGVTCYWIVDTDGRAIEAYELAEGTYRLVTRAAGSAPVSLPPFPDLALVVDALWP